METGSQQHQIISIVTPLGEDALILNRFTAVEGLSELFQVQAVAYTNNRKISERSLMGKTVAIVMHMADDSEPRYFHGVVNSMKSLGTRMPAAASEEKFFDYAIEIVPQVQMLSHRSNCRIYQGVSVPEIIEQLLGEHGIAFELALKKSYPPLEYCVQYHETDLEFVHRLLAQEGIFYRFVHSESSHEMLFIDDPSSYKPCSEAEVIFSSGSLAEPHVFNWQGQRRITSPGLIQQGYDFEKPDKKLEGKKTFKAQSDFLTAAEHYQYQAESEYAHRAKDISAVRLQALHQNKHQSFGSSSCRSFAPGLSFSFSKHEDAGEQGKSYVLTRVTTIAAITNQAGANKTEHQQLFNQFICMPRSQVFRPALAEKPRIPGLQTATVTGKKDEEIETDKYGRIKVQFHWDREGKMDSESSCWIRVAQSFAGNSWGAAFLPRVGQEVLVEFLDGDPDLPMVTGAVYNGKHSVPYSYPDDKHISGVKTQSTKGGSASTANEIRFEDLLGKELFHMQAEKDQTTLVKNDRHTEVQHDQSLKVANNQTDEIGKVRQTKVGDNDKLSVGKKLEIDAGDSVVIKTGGATITMKSSGQIDIKGSKITINGSAIALKAGTISLN